MGNGVCSRRQRRIFQCLLLLTVVCGMLYGGMVSYEMHKQLKRTEAMAVKYQQHQESLSAQLQGKHRRRRRRCDSRRLCVRAGDGPARGRVSAREKCEFILVAQTVERVRSLKRTRPLLTTANGPRFHSAASQHIGSPTFSVVALKQSTVANRNAYFGSDNASLDIGCTAVCYYFGAEDPLICLWADNIKQELIQMLLLSQ